MTTAAWQAEYQWAVGTRVAIEVGGRRAPWPYHGLASGTVVKENTTTVRIEFDDAQVQTVLGSRTFPMTSLTRLTK